MASDIKRYGTSGIHTIEGNLAGRRAAKLTKEREKQELEYLEKKKKIELENDNTNDINTKFQSHSDINEAEFIRQTTGLVTAEEFKKKRKNLMNKLMLDIDDHTKDNDKNNQIIKKKHKKNNKKINKDKHINKKNKCLLSFQEEEEEDNSINNNRLDNKKQTEKKKKSLKNPFVNTSFLPDKQRDLEEEEEKKRLKQEWIFKQEKIKEEPLEIIYSFWDGSGHRNNITVPKKTKIGRFLEIVRQHLVKEFPQLRCLSAENLLYVKEDLIIPHEFSFYDLIITKARGKSGPLFHFDVHEDIRLLSDANVEKEDSHPGKVVERHWYEKNKHIFPATRWEIYDPNKKVNDS